MKLKLLLIAAACILLAGCATVTPVNTTLPVSVTLTTDDLNIGGKITHTMPYDEKDPNMHAKLYNEAIVKSGYDFIILPQYEIKSSLFSDTITITGYGAVLKR